ncbi:hypothetical protein GGR50DRAFT_670719 [Xylaria sp. CBS 124048]|nr:hypothetical protein GGR50DRAFT_670719 [Xylaria sp. CBS 124048]
MSRYEDGYPPRGANADYYTYSTYSSGGKKTAGTPLPNPHQLRLTYEPEEPSYSSCSQSETLGPHSRQRGLQTPSTSSHDKTISERDYLYGPYDDSDSDSDSDSEDDHGPIAQVKRFIDNTFTGSMTGLGVGVLGALVGGLAGRKVADHASRQQRRGGERDASPERRHNQLIGTVVGAAVGALGANAMQKRAEVHRARDRAEQERREYSSFDDDVPRSRNRGHRHHPEDWDITEAERGRDGGRHGIGRDVNRGSRSWTTVEEWVLDDGNSPERGYDYRHDHSSKLRLVGP